MQVMDNLLSNAFRYSPAKGKIMLGARKVGNDVDIFVQDSGSGIPDEELSRIFNRFYRADKSRHAESGESGLGLAIVKALVEAHHGRVWAESNQENGTTVHVCLPAAS
jgi:signal transduction histidine kinase